jgi:hypothetical protein
LLKKGKSGKNGWESVKWMSGKVWCQKRI